MVTCDYLPDNYAHQYADDYRNVSIVDRHAVTRAAIDVGADGIISFAADPGVISAAYAAEQLGLPRQVSAQTAETLQNKHEFRSFLEKNDLPAPRSWVVEHGDDLKDLDEDVDLPVIVKPTDAAGSKGVARVENFADLETAVQRALTFSLSGRCIIESFITTDEPQRSAEGFAIDGEFVALHFMDQLFDQGGMNPYAPVGNVLPSTLSAETRAHVTQDLQRIADLLDFGSGIFNIELRVGLDGRPYIIEVSPRGGGNRLAEFIRAATGEDLIRATVQAALGERVGSLTLTPRRPGYVWIQEMLFSRDSGTFESLQVDPRFDHSSSRSIELWVAPGEPVSSFTHATFALGSTFARYETRKQAYGDIGKACTVILENPHEDTNSP